MNYVEIELSDGTKLRWTVPNDADANLAAAALENILGPPDTMLL